MSATRAGRTPIKLMPPEPTPRDGVRARAAVQHRRRAGRHAAGLLDRPARRSPTHSYKQFVDAGGYRDPEVLERAVPRRIACSPSTRRWRDSATRPADRAPRRGKSAPIPEGQADYPVGGISWFEAAAYAEFAGKSLPSIYHWYRAAGADDVFSDVLRLSNFDGKGAVAPANAAASGRGARSTWRATSRNGALNAVASRHQRYILGGGWNEPSYRFARQEAQIPGIVTRRSACGW